jgi:hypothetical protein
MPVTGPQGCATRRRGKSDCLDRSWRASSGNQPPREGTHMTDKQKVKMKVGDVEFEAEGTAEEVQAQLARFLAMVRPARPAAPAPAPAPAPKPAAKPAAKPEAESKPADAPAMRLIKRFFTEGA